MKKQEENILEEKFLDSSSKGIILYFLWQIKNTKPVQLHTLPLCYNSHSKEDFHFCGKNATKKENFGTAVAYLTTF